MFSSGTRNLHPVLRYCGVLICALLAAATVLVSAVTNPHAAAWLFGFYTTSALLVVVARRIRESRLHALFAAYLVMLASYLVTVWAMHDIVPLGANAGIQQRMEWVNLYLGFGANYVPVALLSLTLEFLNYRPRFLRAIEWSGWILGTVATVLQYFHVFFTGFFWAGYTWVPKFNPIYRWYFYFITFYLTLDLGIPLIVLFTTRQRRRHLQSLYYVIASLPLWLTCWSHFLIMLGVNLYPAGGIFFIFHVSVLSYAVLNHRIYDVTIPIRRSLPYAAVSVLLGGVYGLIVWALMHLNLIVTPAHSILSAGIFMGCVGLLFAPALDYCRRILDRLFLREEADRQRRLEDFVRATSSTIELRRIIEALCLLLDAVLKPARVRVYLSSEQRTPVLYGEFEHAFVPAFWPSGEVLQENIDTGIGNQSHAVVLKSAQTVQKSGPIQVLHHPEMLVAPIFHLGERFGCVVLDGKRSDEAYEDDDVRWAQLAVNHGAVAMANARSFADFKEAELRAQRHEGLAKVGEMISAINHEIRNTLQPVKQQLNYLQQITVQDATVQRAIHVMPDRIAALDRLLRNLTNLARPIELRKREVKLKEVLEAAWLEVRELSAEPDRIRFNIGVQPGAESCIADGQYLKQVIYNLLKNALEATLLQSAPRIDAVITRVGERARIEIRDNGTGIDPEVRKKLFEPFHSTKGGAGTGLGLSISRRIVELHGGTLAAGSPDGAGATFLVELPAGAPVTVSAASAKSSPEIIHTA